MKEGHSASHIHFAAPHESVGSSPSLQERGLGGESYSHFLSDFRLLIEGETDRVSLLANAAAALHDAFGFFWVGFYIVHDEEWLHLGPFQGPVACTRIKRGRGVCGTAWQQAQTIVVPDVEQFPGHIACSSLSRSEIVVPLRRPDGTVVAVLDIDSTHLNVFDDTDREGLEQVAQALMKQW